MDCFVVDIGNTSTAVGLSLGGRITDVAHLHGGLKDASAIAYVVRGIAGKRKLSDSVLCSVVPAANPIWQATLKRVLGRSPLLVTNRVKLGVAIEYPKPRTIGADRLADACGAFRRYGAPVIVADFGTALTFDIVSKPGKYVGGVIAPGLPLMIDYLAEKTALLPHIELKGVCPTIGRSTEGAMRIGAKIGYRGMVREIVTYLQATPGMRNAALCATGGYARWALEGLDMPFHFDPDLTLFGLGCIHELNAK